MLTELTLTNTWRVNLFLSLTVWRNFSQASLSLLQRIGLSCATRSKADGLYHQNRLAVAPNGSISYINDVSASIHPITQRIEERQEKKIGKIYYPAAGLSTETIPYYTSAYDMDMRKVIDVYAAATEHVDQVFLWLSLCAVIFLKVSMSGKKKASRQPAIFLSCVTTPSTRVIKSIYYVRTFTDDGGEVGANQCESCVI